MEVKNVLACLWFLTFAATEIKGEVVCFVHINVYVFYIGHYLISRPTMFSFPYKIGFIDFHRLLKISVKLSLQV